MLGQRSSRLSWSADLASLLATFASAFLLAPAVSRAAPIGPIDDLKPAPASSTPHAPSPGALHILYLNFEGATLTATGPGGGYVGPDNAPANQSGVIDMTKYSTVAYPPFDASVWSSDPAVAGLSRAQIIQQIAGEVAGYYAAYDIDIVTTRPAGGNYTMTMVGGSSSTIGEPSGVGGVAVFDCTPSAGVAGSDSNPNNIAFAFSDSIASFGVSIKMVAVTISQESAHTYGLGHTANQMDLMYWQLSGVETAFLAGAFDPSDPSVPLEQQCFPGATMQDSNGLLLQILGPRSSRTSVDMGVVAYPPEAGTVPPIDSAVPTVDAGALPATDGATRSSGSEAGAGSDAGTAQTAVIGDLVGGCSLSSHPRSRREGALGLALLLVGLASLGLARRRHG